MLLVVSNRGDTTTDWLVVELNRRSAPFVRFNTEDYPMSTRIVWTPGGDVRLVVGDRTVAGEAVHAVWYRRPLPPRLPPDVDADLAEWAAGEAQEALDGVWRTLETRWVNLPDANRRASSKPDQPRRARDVGLTVPRTLVTNDPTEAAQFAAATGRVVVKPLRSSAVAAHGRPRVLWTTELDDAAKARLESLGPEPYLLQERVGKRRDVRVTIVGDRLFATAITTPDSAPVDWRRSSTDDLRHEHCELPQAVQLACLQLMRHYGLRFAALDLAETTDGYVFFELNPNGQWAWLERRTGVPLREALADELLEER